MLYHRNVKGTLILGVLMGLFLPGCAQQPVSVGGTDERTVALEACKAAQPDDPVVGSGLSKRQANGTVAEWRTVLTLHASGEMAYTEQLKRPRQPSQGLAESGCWWREGDVLVLETRESNGSIVDTSDPIFTNRFTVISVEAEKLKLANPVGSDYELTRTSPGYRLPF